MTSVFRRDQRLFYVQREPRLVWHIERPDDAELMLCGERISVDAPFSTVQSRPGLKMCLWCDKYLGDTLLEHGQWLESDNRSMVVRLSPSGKSGLPGSTMRTGPGLFGIGSRGPATTGGG